MKDRAIRTNSSGNGGYSFVFTLPKVTQGFSVLKFCASWGVNRVYDIVIASSNGTNVWLTKKSLMDNKMKYYYHVNGDNVEIYAHDYTSNYLLVTGMYSLRAYNANVTHKNEAVSTLPSDCVEAENYSS